MATTKRRRSSEEKAADDRIREHYKKIIGRKRVHGRVVRTCHADWEGCLNANHYKVVKE